MQEFMFGHYRLSVDVEATRAYYAAHPESWITCECEGCRNFAAALGTLPRAVVDFFKAMGLDPAKPAELCYYQGDGAGPLRWRMVSSGGHGVGGFFPVGGLRGVSGGLVRSGRGLLRGV